jgi:hypothetical protein
VAYTPDWVKLADALKRVVGVSDDEAKLDICRAIADGRIGIRLAIAEQSARTVAKVFADWSQLVAETQGLVPRSPRQKADNQAAPLESYECLEGANIKVPKHLLPNDFDWENSRPLKPWQTGRRVWKYDEGHSFTWTDRPILFVELRTTDLIALMQRTYTSASPEGAAVQPSREGLVEAPETTGIARLTKPKRGRPAIYNWLGVKVRLRTYVTENGPLQTLEELLQKCADFAAELHPKKHTPDDATIREAIKTHALDNAAAFAPGKSPGK